jgi:hypothetical protein
MIEPECPIGCRGDFNGEPHESDKAVPEKLPRCKRTGAVEPSAGISFFPHC